MSGNQLFTVYLVIGFFFLGWGMTLNEKRCRPTPEGTTALAVTFLWPVFAAGFITADQTDLRPCKPR